MELNKIWMRYFLLGLIGSLLLLMNSCKVNYAQHGEFQFNNETNYTITYKKGFEKYNLIPKGKVAVDQIQDSGKTVNSTTYKSSFFFESGIALPFVITFNNSKCLIVTFEDNFGPLNIKNYLAEKIGSRTYKFTYTFTEADYNRATTCP